ncbi:hypothetical protein K1719_031790 [Acacia pycnantha]|nr:hypothetical protein K1719_031790 [Acacia pycnantha]
MKLLNKNFALNQPGTIKIIPEEWFTTSLTETSSPPRQLAKTIEDHKNIELGSFHTLTLERNKLSNSPEGFGIPLLW